MESKCVSVDGHRTQSGLRLTSFPCSTFKAFHTGCLRSPLEFKNILARASIEAHRPKDGFCIHPSGEGLEETRLLLAVQIGQDRFNPAGYAEFAIDVMEVCLHGIKRYTQLVRDVFIASPGRGMCENLPLPLGQQCNS